MSTNSNVDISEVLRQLRAGGNMPEELVEIFGEEAEEHMRNIYDGLDRMRVDANDMTALGDVRRSSHTLKGAAGAVGFEAITRLSHRMEDLLDWLADQNQGPSETQLQLLLITADQIEEITTSEINFDEAAQTLVDIYVAYEKEMESLTAAGSTSPETDPGESIENDAQDFLAALDALEIDHDGLEEAASVPAPCSVDAEEIETELLASSTVTPDLAEIFREEADEHLATIGAGLQCLIAEPTDANSAAEIRRTAHTLKGAAGAVGMMAMHRLAYRIENLLDLSAENSSTPSADQLELLTDSAEMLMVLGIGAYEVDEVVARLVEIYVRYEAEFAGFKLVEPQASAASVEVAALMESTPKQPGSLGSESESQTSEQVDVPKTRASQTQPTQYLRVPLDRLDSLVALVGEMIVNRSSFSQRLTDFAERIEEMNASLARLRGVANEVETQYSVEALKSGSLRDRNGLGKNRIKGAFAGNDTQGLDSLEFDRYTDFHLLARSLTETTNDVAVITSELRNLHGDFDSLLNRQQRFNRDAQSSLMHVRMVPVGNIANRLERTVRSVSNKLGKKVDLSITGENTELDKTVLEEITDPLLHLIRNALDHGIENAEDRSAIGKPDRSALKVEALNQGTQVTIRVIDDGRGLDSEKIRQKAIERGLVDAEKKLSEEEINSLIFLPGFSTADSLTDVSGRGVGMDVVREAVQRLKGTIQVESTKGEGSVFTIHLPTTLAVSTALLVESCGHNFAIPMQSIQQIIRLDPKAVTKVGAHPMINLGDRMLLLKDLSNHMEIRSETEDFVEAKAMLLVRTGDDEVALTVDAIGGGQDIVVKSLGDHLRHVRGYLGATVSGDGTVIPILDPADLCGQETSKRKTFGRRKTDSVNKTLRKLAMVIDDSLSVRRVTTNMLQSFGWEVIDAKDGVDALEKLALADTPPDVFLCDMEMPRMDGLELVSRIRSQREFLTTPVVMVTSRAAEKHRRMAREAGANEHVVKPFNDESLMNLIEKMVSEHREMVGV